MDLKVWSEWDDVLAELWDHCDNCSQCIKVQDSVSVGCDKGQEIAQRLAQVTLKEVD